MGAGSFDADEQFTTERIESATVDAGDGRAGWTLRFVGGLNLWCTAAECDVQPQPGEEARLYGKGLGYTVRGIVISGRRYRYQTEEEAAAEDAAWCEKWDAEQAARKAQHEAEIARGQHAPVFFQMKEGTRADWERGLASNTDPYGRCCYLFAADWAARMEKELAEGKTVAAIAKDTCREADRKHGVTGFMYGVAVGLLSHCWQHGEELRRWHNLDTQVGTEGERANESGGVLNPAVVNVSA